MSTAAGIGKQNFVPDEDLLISVNSNLGEPSINWIKTDEAMTSGETLRKYACKHVGCCYTTSYSRDLKRHLRIHSGEQPFQCGTCKRRFNRLDKLKVHERLHVGIKTLCCTKCDFTTRNSRSFEKHMRNHSDGVPYRNKCPTLTGECQYFVVNVSPETVPLLSLPSDEKVGNAHPPLSADSWSIGSVEITVRKPVLMPSNADEGNSKRLRRFACDYNNCQFISAYKKDLTRHLRIHSGEQPFECEICKRRFNRSDKLKLHERSHSGEKPSTPKLKKFVCHHVDCQYASAYRKDLRRHMHVHSGIHPFQCGICKRKFKRSDTLKLHEQSHIEDDHTDGGCKQLMCAGMQSDESHSSMEPGSHPSLPCDKMKIIASNDMHDFTDAKAVGQGTTTAERPSLIRAKPDRASNCGFAKRYLCYHSGCKFTSAYPKHLTRHLRIHSGEQPFECSICNKKFNRSDKLKLHQQTRICGKSYCCEKCDYETRGSRSFKKHLSIHSVENHCRANPDTFTPSLHHDKPEADARNRDEYRMPNEDAQVSANLMTVRCSLGSAKGPVSKLRKGRGNFGKAKKYACDYAGCQFVSAYKKDLVRHLRVHSGEKPFECSTCKRKFNRSDKLKLHERTHTGDKPYKCDKCDYASAEGSSLRIHSRIHSEDNPYRCQICLYSCRFSSQLATHMKIHTSETLHSCKLCQCKFEVSTELEQHELLHMSDKLFECAACDYKCTLKGNLKMHFSLKCCSKQRHDQYIHPSSSQKTFCNHTKPHELKCALDLHFCTHQRPC